jgi:YhcH/YjgK/YiaL family protein
MIIDRKENAELYKGVGERIKSALNFINNTDCESLTLGKHDIDGDDVFALVSEYQTKDSADCQLEAHRKFIDVQYVVSGAELMGYAPLKGQEASMTYNEDDDFILYPATVSFTKVESGMFAIFYPGDLHMPGIMIDNSSPVKKIVIKVRV